MTVPVVVLAQAWRGGPQQNVSRLLKGCQMIDTDELMSQAGTLCATAGTSDVVDALVVVIALRYRAAVVTSDPGDIGRLATPSRSPERQACRAAIATLGLTRALLFSSVGGHEHQVIDVTAAQAQCPYVS